MEPECHFKHSALAAPAAPAAIFGRGMAVPPVCTTDYINTVQHGTAYFSLLGTGSQLHMQLLSSPLPGTAQTQTQRMLSCWKSFSFAWIRTGDILYCASSQAPQLLTMDGAHTCTLRCLPSLILCIAGLMVLRLCAFQVLCHAMLQVSKDAQPSGSSCRPSAGQTHMLLCCHQARSCSVRLPCVLQAVPTAAGEAWQHVTCSCTCCYAALGAAACLAGPSCSVSCRMLCSSNS